MKVWIDGATARICYIIEGQKPVVHDLSQKATSNQGEYWALIYALLDLISQGLTNKINIYSDSELMVHQVNSRLDKSYKPHYQVKSAQLISLAEWATDLFRFFKRLKLSWLAREDNPSGIYLEKTKVGKS